MQFRDLSAILGDAAGTVAPAIQLVVRHRGDLVVDGAWGWLDPEGSIMSPARHCSIWRR